MDSQLFRPISVGNAAGGGGSGNQYFTLKCNGMCAFFSSPLVKAKSAFLLWRFVRLSHNFVSLFQRCHQLLRVNKMVIVDPFCRRSFFIIPKDISAGSSTSSRCQLVDVRCRGPTPTSSRSNSVVTGSM